MAEQWTHKDRVIEQELNVKNSICALTIYKIWDSSQGRL
jgi:hypothetical protein